MNDARFQKLVLSVGKEAANAAWTVVQEHQGLKGVVTRHMSATTSAPDYLKREIIERFQSDADLALFEAAIKYASDHEDHAKFETYATKVLKNAWNDAARAVRAERGEAPERGLRSDEKLRSSVGLADLTDADLLSRDRYPGRKNFGGDRRRVATGFEESELEQLVNELKHQRQDDNILRIIQQTLGISLRDTPNLTDREAEAVGVYLWGPYLDLARAHWRFDGFHMMLTLLIAEGQHLSRAEVARMMQPGSWGGKSRPVSRQNATMWLDQAARKLGASAPESLRHQAVLGLSAWSLRIEALRQMGRYVPPKLTSETESWLRAKKIDTDSRIQEMELDQEDQVWKLVDADGAAA